MVYRTPYGNSSKKYKANYTFKKKKEGKPKYSRSESKKEVRALALAY